MKVFREGGRFANGESAADKIPFYAGGAFFSGSLKSVQKPLDIRATPRFTLMLEKGGFTMKKISIIPLIALFTASFLWGSEFVLLEVALTAGM